MNQGKLTRVRLPCWPPPVWRQTCRPCSRTRRQRVHLLQPGVAARSSRQTSRPFAPAVPVSLRQRGPPSSVPAARPLWSRTALLSPAAVAGPLLSIQTGLLFAGVEPLVLTQTSRLLAGAGTPGLLLSGQRGHRPVAVGRRESGSRLCQTKNLWRRASGLLRRQRARLLLGASGLRRFHCVNLVSSVLGLPVLGSSLMSQLQTQDRSPPKQSGTKKARNRTKQKQKQKLTRDWLCQC